MPAVWERSGIRQLYRNYLMTDFAQAFQNDQKHFRCCAMRSINWLVKLSSHVTFLMHMVEFVW